jgi:hypothetical protein
MRQRDPSRFLQFGFLALLFLSVLVAGFWITENHNYTRTVQDAAEANASDQARATEIHA